MAGNRAALAQGAEESAQDANQAVGERIRLLRLARGLSLKELAARAGLSVALISQIERGVSSASVRVLAKLADGLDVTISDLFEPSLEETDGDRFIARVKDRRHIESKAKGVTKELLTPFKRDPRLNIYILAIEPDCASDDDRYEPKSEAAGVVLEGGIELFVDGRRYVLGEGDSFRFAGDRPHRFLNAGRKTAKILWTLYSAPSLPALLVP